MKTTTMTLILMTSLLLMGCGPGSAPDESEAAEEGMPGMPGMGDMRSMDRMQEGGAGMMGRMAAHMDMMQTMDGDSIQTMLSEHRQMVGNMIASMNREMRGMDMPADQAWDATVDSLRDDVIAMPDMDAGGLEAMMPAHHRRMTRLMAMHRQMMADMDM